MNILERLRAAEECEHWDRWMRLWGVIALDAVLTHNLLVMVHASDAETRKLAASEVSRTVLAGIAASVGLVGA